MITIRIVRGRIRIRFYAMTSEELAQIHEKLVADIGSINQVGGTNELSCALSAQNLRKLKKVGVRLENDDHSREVVASLRKRLDHYEHESQRGSLAKKGGMAVPYEFKLKPFAHQVIGFNFLHSMKTPALFGDCGVGKTYMALTFADSMIKQGVKIAFIVVCPVNLIRHVWQDDATKFSDLSFVGLRESSAVQTRAEDFDDPKDPKDPKARARLRADRRRDDAWKKKAKRRAQARHRKLVEQRFAQDVDLYIINPENLRTDPKERRMLALCRRKIKEGYELCLIVDESSRVKTRTSRTYKALKRIRAYCSRCIIMTGTPSPNGLLDLWAQFSILDDGLTLHPSFTDYRHETCREQTLRYVSWIDAHGHKHNATKWIPKPGAPKKVYRQIEPRVIRFQTEACIDLPPRRFITRDVEMSAEQSSVYNEMKDRLYLEIDDETVTASVAMTKLLKLREITGGFVISDAGDAIPLGSDAPKMLELDRLLEQSIGDKIGDESFPSKALVWAQYRWECTSLVERYKKKYGARGLFGGISSTKKDYAIQEFKRDPSSRLLICHPASVGHGLTLTEANYAFYYSLSYNFEEFYQSFRRMTRPGQKRSMTYYFLVCPGTIDEELLSAIKTKKNLSDIITDGKLPEEPFIEQNVEWDITDD